MIGDTGYIILENIKVFENQWSNYEIFNNHQYNMKIINEFTTKVKKKDLLIHK